MTEGTEVRAVTRNPDAAALPSLVEVMRGDLSDPDSLDRCLSGIELYFSYGQAHRRQLLRHWKESRGTLGALFSSRPR
jgi:uncharacterized protein YbjT (DUF2867 family)